MEKERKWKEEYLYGAFLHQGTHKAEQEKEKSTANPGQKMEIKMVCVEQVWPDTFINDEWMSRKLRLDFTVWTSEPQLILLLYTAQT